MKVKSKNGIKMAKRRNKEKVIEYSKLENKVAALWTRVSTEKQEKNNCSLENQKQICREYAEAHGIRIKAEFGGTHESAKNEGKLYREMIAKVARDKEINIILVYSFDRFSRAGNEAIMTKAYLKSKGIYVVSATQITDPDSAAGTFMENILFLFNQFENDLRRDKAVMGMTECLRKGYWYQQAPLGYDRKKEGKAHILTVNETGKILKNAFIWKATENVSDIEVVRRLRQMGVDIDRKHLNKILHNRFYCGYIEHNLLGEEIIKGKQEVLIDEDTWNKVNGISRAGYEHQEETENFPLKRHIICSACGGYLTGYTVKARNRNYYKCNKKGCCSNHSTDKLHKLYVDLLGQYYIPKEIIPIFSRVLHKVFTQYNEEKGETHSILLKRKTEVKQKIEKAQVRYGLGDISEDVYKVTMQHLKAESAEIERGIDEASKNLSNMEQFIDKAIAISCKLGSLWSNENYSTRQRLQKLIFPNGVLFDKEIDGYRTENENEVFSLFRRFTENCDLMKTKATTEYLRLSPFVGMRRLERPTPTSRT